MPMPKPTGKSENAVGRFVASVICDTCDLMMPIVPFRRPLATRAMTAQVTFGTKPKTADESDAASPPNTRQARQP